MSLKTSDFRSAHDDPILKLAEDVGAVFAGYPASKRTELAIRLVCLSQQRASETDAVTDEMCVRMVRQWAK